MVVDGEGEGKGELNESSQLVYGLVEQWNSS